ncbi:MAG TPA: class I SAM-dependent methyltransferase [Solirubrobacteraceae bacterium]|nr:class I SAM-dependent methyltransferase [Solirubrobacteraceae bacterium]
MSAVIWHDIECGAYAEDLPLWRSLAASRGDPVLDVGAGTGRVALDLARAGYQVTALDRDPDLLDALAARASGRKSELLRPSSRPPVRTVVGDARDFDLGQQFPLVIVPMQTIQLLGGDEGRVAFLRCAHKHLTPGGVLAAAIAEVLELYEVIDGFEAPLPDIREYDGVVYSSQPTAVRAEHGGFVLERRRETVAPKGERTVEENLIRLDGLTGRGLEREGRAAGFTPAGRATVRATADYSGSEVVMLRA